MSGVAVCRRKSRSSKSSSTSPDAYLPESRDSEFRLGLPGGLHPVFLVTWYCFSSGSPRIRSFHRTHAVRRAVVGIVMFMALRSMLLKLAPAGEAGASLVEMLYRSSKKTRCL